MNNGKSYRDGLLQAFEIADMYADENMRMADDTVHADPILNRQLRQRLKSCAEVDAAALVSERLAFDGLMHSSRSHAARDIADTILALMEADDNAQV